MKGESRLAGDSPQKPEGEITLLLQRWRQGERDAFDELMPVVYPQLHKIAGCLMRRERDPGAMQATALVNEFYLKLLDRRRVNWEDRRHFFNFAAHAMRMILIDQARQAQAPMHGGGLERVPLDEEMAWAPVGSPEFIDLNRAIDELNAISPEKVRMLELRYFLGCTAEETAELTEVSKATVDREMRFVRAWLFERMHPAPGGAPGPA